MVYTFLGSFYAHLTVCEREAYHRLIYAPIYMFIIREQCKYLFIHVASVSLCIAYVESVERV